MHTNSYTGPRLIFKAILQQTDYIIISPIIWQEMPCFISLSVLLDCFFYADFFETHHIMYCKRLTNTFEFFLSDM
jgi:hypothetical protein